MIEIINKFVNIVTFKKLCRFTIANYATGNVEK